MEIINFIIKILLKLLKDICSSIIKSKIMSETKASNYMKEYYKNNKGKYQDYYNEKKHCELCNADYSKLNFNKHIKTAKHIRKEKVTQNHQIELTPEMMTKLMKLLETTEQVQK